MSLFLLFILILYFLVCPQQAFYATQEGILLWFDRILPTLLPFSVFSYLVLESHTLDALSRRLPQKLPRLLSMEELCVLLCGFLFGFPIGSKLTADFYKKGRLSAQRAQILCICTNNMSPVFISSFVLTQMLGQPERIGMTYVIVYLIPFTGCILALLFGKEAGKDFHKKTASRFHLNMQIIDAGILSGFETLIKLCGYIVLFRIVIEMQKLLPLPPVLSSLLFCVTEVTNGIACLPNSGLGREMTYLLAVGALSFGGLCGAAQTGSMLAGTGLSVKRYLWGKLLLALLCMAAAACLLHLV